MNYISSVPGYVSLNETNHWCKTCTL